MIELKEEQKAVIKQQGDYAVVAITKHGVDIARTLGSSFQNADVYYMSKFEKGDEEARDIQLFTGSVRMLLPPLFESYKGLIIIISLGAVVRMIAPLLKDKKVDPAVVVIDDKGEHVISLLSGHIGGANELTKEIAAVLQARPIITTASDVQQTIPVDLFGKRFGWVWESAEKLTPVSASVVNEEKVAVVQESGEKEWWPYDRPLPENFKVFPSVAEALDQEHSAALVITHRELTEQEKRILHNGVLYRPKVIVLGMGCNRGTSAEEIEEVINETLEELQLSSKSVKALCTIDIKKAEEGLIKVANKNGWEFIYYTPTVLNSVKVEDPSETVFKYTGAYAVSEPAALLYSGAEKLELVKKKSGNVTISVAIIPY
ncbi:cobalamin biosynthesis protein CbiG [Bacillus canaveralius]|uniref:Cobalamin biosynthesis protein CbiG n=1 Tax=Bacillus canaveralius TaxID=1403243 RepID=A0A2N5GHY8_9BACI|nr:cobalamin biosynthesis protein [Bacillus canaveralius]PLR80396.1 cobalamin biosynthesis protein CbiG [Bacillus canaveralius]PLR88876.1 cobalamin biosynthesis protein CbiG [Bacillus canaveralius]